MVHRGGDRGSTAGARWRQPVPDEASVLRMSGDGPAAPGAGADPGPYRGSRRRTTRAAEPGPRAPRAADLGSGLPASDPAVGSPSGDPGGHASTRPRTRRPSPTSMPPDASGPTEAHQPFPRRHRTVSRPDDHAEHSDRSDEFWPTGCASRSDSSSTFLTLGVNGMCPDGRCCPARRPADLLPHGHRLIPSSWIARAATPPPSWTRPSRMCSVPM